MRPLFALSVLVLSAYLLVGCSADAAPESESSPAAMSAAESTPAAEVAAQAEAPAAQAHEGLMAHMPWSRPLAPGAKVAAGYAHLMNHSDNAERLVSARAEGVGRVEIHTMSEVDGVMQMRPLEDGLALPVNGMAMLQPGGNHLMFFDVTRSWNDGDTVPVTLVFESGKETIANFAVKQGEAPASDEQKHH